MQGHRDSPLSDLGVRQARQLARRLAEVPFDALYSSDSGRARRTALSIAEVTRHEIILDMRLRERHFGVFEGLTAPEIEREFPEDYLRFRNRDPDYTVPGGENTRAFHGRCMGCLAEIARRHAGDTVVVVTHGLVLDMAYRTAESLAFDQPRPVPLLNASLNAFRYLSGGWRMESWGDVNHLVAESVTEFEEGGA